MARSPTIVDVAKAAGVSVATVSRVVRDHEDVSDATRERVQRVIRGLGYRPSPLARALVSGRSGLIALLVSDIVDPFYPQLARSVEREATKGGYGVVICNTADDVEETREYLERLASHGVEGIIHASVGDDEAMVARLTEDIPVVFTDRRPSATGSSFVVADNMGGARALTRHVLELGRQDIAFVGGPMYASNAADREAGYEAAMREAGLRPHVIRGGMTRDSGRQATREVMAGIHRPTAIIGVTDHVAIGVMEALRAISLRIPGDVAVAGFDDIELASSSLVGLTSVAQDIDRMGARAFHLLSQLMRRGRQARPKVRREVLKCEVVPRASTIGG